MLRTKLYKPTAKNTLVYRQGLSDKLEKAQNQKLILVSAPAGYGKSTAISQWIDQYQHASSWYSLDKSDNDPATFLRYLIAAIQSKHISFGKEAEKLLELNSSSSLDSIATYMVNDLYEISERFCIVLDDYHLIENREVNDLLSFFLDNFPVNFQLVLITRSDPSIPLARLRSMHQLAEIRLADLCFSANDVYNFFKKSLDIKLTAELAKILETKTEGWIAGLQLTGLSMQGKTDVRGFVEKLRGDNRYIMDYLIEEALQQQAPGLRDFLLSTSIFKRFNSSLCDFVLEIDNSQEIIESLDKNNLFVIALDSERNWYRYHHLFEQLLLNRLSNANKQKNKLHKRASIWFEEHGMLEDAIQHSLQIKDYDKSISLINSISSQLWANANHKGILDYGELLPDDEIYKSPEFSLYYSWVLMHSGQVTKAMKYLHNAEAAVDDKLSKGEGSKDLLSLKGKIAVLYAFAYSHEEAIDKMFSCCKSGMKYLSEDDPFWYSWSQFTYGLAYFSKGDLPQAQKAFDIAYKHAQSTGNIYLMSTILSRLAETEQQLGTFSSAYDRCAKLFSHMKDLGYGEVAKEEWTYAPLYLIMGVTELGWAELDKAYENIKIAYHLSKKGNDNFYKVYVSVIYSICLNYQGNKDGELIAKELDELVEQTTISPFLMSFYITSKVYWCIEKNQVELANQLFAKYDIRPDGEIDHAYEMAYSALARTLIHEHKLTEAELLLTKLHAFAQKNNENDRLIEIHTSFAVLYARRYENEKAVDHLMKAMALSVVENQLFIFVFWSAALKDILEEIYKLHAIQKTTIPSSFIKNLQQAIKNADKRKQKKSESDLSERELETLVLLSEEISNQEIADRSFISLNTVKTRLKNIFLKLDVDSRRKAVAKAKEMGLI